MIMEKHAGNLMWYVDFVLLCTNFYEGKGTNLTGFKQGVRDTVLVIVVLHCSLINLLCLFF